MPVDSTALYFPLLLLLLPGIWLGALGLARRLVESKEIAYLLAPGLLLSAWLLGMHAFSLVLGSFFIGLAVATLVLGVGGYCWWLLQGRTVGPMASGSLRFTPWTWFGAVVSTLLITILVMNGWGSDQISVPGHITIIMQLLNDVYPPHFSRFPEFEYRYHYGVNTLCAAVALVLHLPADISIDLLVVGSWFYLWLLLWAAGDRMFGSAGRVLLPGIILLAGGTQPLFYLFHDTFSIPENISLLSSISNVRIGGGGLVFRHFFQSPFMLGFILMFCLVLLLSYRKGRMSPSHYLSIGLLFVTLSFSHIVVFVTLLGATLMQLFVEIWRERDRQAALWTFATALLVILVSPLLHGFFAPSYNPGDGLPIVINQTEEAYRHLGRNLIMWFGVAFPALGLIGMFFLNRLRTLWLSLFFGCLLVLVLFRYPYSWDIVKFAVITSVVLSVGVVCLIVRLLRTDFRYRRAISILVVIACVYPNTAFILSSYWKYYVRPPVSLGQEDQQIVSWLRGNTQPGELILVSEPEIAKRYSIWGGLDTVFDITQNVALHGIPADIISKRRELLRSLPQDINLYWDEGIRWVVVGPRYLPALKKRIEEWHADKMVRLAFKSGDIMILELQPRL